MSSDGEQLQFHFVPELERLRNTSYVRAGSAVGVALEGGRQLEIEAEFAPPRPGSTVGLALFGGAVRLAFNASSGELFFDGSATQPIGGNPGAQTPRFVATTLRLRPGEALRLHVYVDGSIVEAIANERAPLHAIIVPAADDSLQFAAVGQDLTHVAVHTLVSTTA